MKKWSKVFLFSVMSFLLGISLAFSAVVSAQQSSPTLTPTPVDPNANINWPPPVYVLRGEVAVRGSANLPNMSSFFLEFRPLNEDLTPQEDAAPWFPATLPNTVPVNDNVLGVWQTTTAPDGVYELRLTLNVSGGLPVFYIVRPLRIENTPPPFVTIEAPVPTSTPQVVQPLPPTPTAPSVTGPAATALTNANVRAGDSTSYAVVGSLTAGDVVPIIGLSSTGSGWYYIQLSNGQRGFVAPSVVQVSGNVAGLPRIAPPATPTPPATATPNLPDIAFIGLRYDRATIKQGEAFNVIASLRNDGGATNGSTVILCTLIPSAGSRVELVINVDGIAPGQTREFSGTTQLNSGGGGTVTVQCAFDVNRLIQELRTDNNFFNITTPLGAP